MRTYCVVSGTGKPIRWGTCADADFEIQPAAGEEVVEDWPPSEQHTWNGEEWVAP